MIVIVQIAIATRAHEQRTLTATQRPHRTLSKPPNLASLFESATSPSTSLTKPATPSVQTSTHVAVASSPHYNNDDHALPPSAAAVMYQQQQQQSNGGMMRQSIVEVRVPLHATPLVIQPLASPRAHVPLSSSPLGMSNDSILLSGGPIVTWPNHADDNNNNNNDNNIHDNASSHLSRNSSNISGNGLRTRPTISSPVTRPPRPTG
jgi:hypothetical protein